MLKKGIHYIRIFIMMPRERKRLLLRGTWYSVQLEYYIRTDNKQQLKQYQQQQEETLLQSEEQRQRIAQVAKVVRIIDKRMPWNPMCLNLSLVAKRLLQEQAIETTLHIGFKPRQVKKEFEGHAWLTIEGRLITGWVPDLAVYRELI